MKRSQTSLEPYRKKRDFRKTAEPAGGGGNVLREAAGRMFVVQKHQARRLHYDLRLEMEGVLKSWAVPKGPSTDPGDKRLAVRVEDHPLEYAGFEGVIPPGEYGAGSVLVWDRGTWEPEGREDPVGALEKGVLKFALHGSKLRGSWVLARMSGTENNWLLIKHQDAAATASSGPSVVERLPRSVHSERTIEEVKAAPGEVFSHGIRFSQLPGAKISPEPPESVPPALATLAETPPRGDDWLHELKLDGYRILATKTGSDVRLRSRNDKDWTARFVSIARELRTLAGDAILDGEVVVLDAQGKSSFQALQQQLRGGPGGALVYFAFDLLWFQGHDLRGVALVERKRALRHLLQETFADAEGAIRFSDHQTGKGDLFYQQACQAGVEGIISKKAQSRYAGARTRDWLKLKCSRRQEFVIGGFTGPGGSRIGFGSLLLGYYDEQGQLRYAGRVGTGFDDATLRDLHRMLQAEQVPQAPFLEPPSRREAKGAAWVEPRRVAEVSFTEWTQDGRLRHPTFRGLREDKEARGVRRERAEAGEAPAAGKDLAGPARVQGAPAGRKKKEIAEVAGIVITHPGRAVFPDAGVTKLEVARYYCDAAPWLLTYAGGRPLSVVRCPEGRHGVCFYQKHLAAGMPGSVHAVQVPGETERYLSVDSEAGLAALAQFGVLEIHPWLARNDRPGRPDMMIFDLDPGEGVPWEEVLGAAFLFRHVLRGLGLESYPKLTGGKGFHLVAPLKRQWDFATVKAAAHALAERVREMNPDRFLTSATKAKRRGKIYLDYLRNGQGATAVAPYSLRARAGAPVAVPLRWEEVRPEWKSDHFSIGTLRQRLEKMGEDPWQGFLRSRQTLTKAALRDLGV